MKFGDLRRTRNVLAPELEALMDDSKPS